METTSKHTTSSGPNTGHPILSEFLSGRNDIRLLSVSAMIIYLTPVIYREKLYTIDDELRRAREKE